MPLLRNAARTKTLKLLFKTTIGPKIFNLQSNNAKGFCYLLLYYWYQIFTNKENGASCGEPGPKKSLAILSRVPLSQLFDELNDYGKQLVHNIFDKTVQTLGADYKIMCYDDYNAQPIILELTLLQWYNSVVDQNYKKKSNK